ncbi:MAG TPA: prenyltransferase/squalene oxidase repeat-containing protein, partial [Planctomycetota bacterium]|nr:prenyltransferase/squalene oxidase repeat-containing protein [Planctomycetota bacterium]
MIRRRAVLLAVLAASLPAGTARADALAVEVNRAIEKGVAHLRTLQNADGSFRGDRSDSFPDGVTALAVYTLLRSEVFPDDPAVKKAVEWLRSRKVEHTYSAAIRILALDALGDPAQAEPILALARWLEDSFHEKDRQWAYFPGDGRTDLSNTQ